MFAQLTAGLGRLPFYFDVRFAPTDEIVYTTGKQFLQFPHRRKVVQLAFTVRNAPFPRPGRYVVESFCNEQWVADTTLELFQGPNP
jgi:hypothetical protein